MTFFKQTVFLPALALAMCIALSACGKTQAPQKAADISTIFELQIDQKPFKAQVAVFDIEKAKGLMFRKSLERDTGMVFVYDTPTQASFWMKNTEIPLDIGFFDKNGVLTEVKKLYPQNLNSVKSSRKDIAYCIEMNAGWFENNGIKPPAKLDMQKLENAIKARKAQ